jgi:hypothetical protein
MGELIKEREGNIIFSQIKSFNIRFSLVGLLLYGLQLLPNIIWKLAPPANNVLSQNASSSNILNFIEGFFGMVTVILMVVNIGRSIERGSNIYIGFAFLFLALYYLSWVLYYSGIVSPWLLILGIAAMPPMYFFFSALWMNNYVLLVPCVIFGVAHIVITSSNY